MKTVFTEQELWEHLFDAKCEHRWSDMTGYAEMAKDGPAIKYDLSVSREGERLTIPAGTTVKIVMVSRMGDLGVTPDLEAQNGYIARYIPGDGYLTNCRLER